MRTNRPGRRKGPGSLRKAARRPLLGVVLALVSILTVVAPSRA